MIPPAGPSSEQIEGTSIAVVGMAGRFPGADNIDQFWANLRDGVESITRFSDEDLLAAGVDPSWLANPNYVKARGLLKDFDAFDAAFFGYSPRDAEIMDPQHRALLETAWTALEYAGYYPEHYKGLIGVYAGVGLNKYLVMNLAGRFVPDDPAQSYQIFVGNDKDFAATRISYKLNLKGPSVLVQAACSTSLVAVHMACQSLLHGECDMALAGGASVHPERAGYFFQEGMVLSPDGHCRAFDAKGHGFVPGSGAAMVVLKRLEDALSDGDTIHAVIRASAINNDGSRKVGYAASSLDGETAAMAEALAVSGVDSDSIGYVETHGTATPLGDPIEVAALSNAYARRKTPCALGSVKSNIGHLDTAAGAAGLIKAILSLKHRMLVPSLHFERPNPQIDFAKCPFFVNTQLVSWERRGEPLRAAVNSLGLGGTNAHVILEEAPIVSNPPSESFQVIPLSAMSREALNQARLNLVEHFSSHPSASLADAAYTLQVGRKPMPLRKVLVAKDVADAASALASGQSNRILIGESKESTKIVFMFPGGGAQHVAMALELYSRYTVFQEEVDRCAELLAPILGTDPRRILFPRGEEESLEATRRINEISTMLPILFVVEYSLARLWMSWGVQPAAMIGHSHGEYVAACLAGVFSLADALTLVATRGKLMQTLPAGAMLSVSLPAAQIRSRLQTNLSLAAVNGPSHCVVAGKPEEIAALEALFSEEGIECKRLHISYAAHSSLSEPIIPEFVKAVASAQRNAPKIPFISNVTGTWINTLEATDPAYWGRHLRETVRFSDGIAEILKKEDQSLIEIGPGWTLCSLARLQAEPERGHTVVPSLRHPQKGPGDLETLMTAVATLWTRGVEIAWTKLHAGEQRRRIPLPTYPFERKRHWIAAPRRMEGNSLERQELNVPAQAFPRSKAASIETARDLLLREPEGTRQEAVRRYLRRRIAERLGLAEEAVVEDVKRLPWDSLLIIEFVGSLRKELLVSIKPSDFISRRTFSDLATLVYDKIWPGSGGSQQGEISTRATIDVGSNPWLPFCRPNPLAKGRLFVFPGAGGSAGTYQKALETGLPADLELNVLQAPGKPWNRLHEVPHSDMAALVEGTIDAIGDRLGGHFAFVGHSLGALVAFEVTRELRRRKLNQPAHLFLCACKAPQSRFTETRPPLSEKETLEMLLGGSESLGAIVGDEAMLTALIKCYRQDVALLSRYAWAEDSPLTCPITVLGGSSDPIFPGSTLEGWRCHTTSDFTIRMLPCGHAFNNYKETLCQMISELLSVAPEISI